jgi:hypothetical protein
MAYFLVCGGGEGCREEHVIPGRFSPHDTLLLSLLSLLLRPATHQFW